MQVITSYSLKEEYESYLYSFFESLFSIGIRTET